MSRHVLILFMGTEKGGCYEFAQKLKKLGMCVSLPQAYLRNSYNTRFNVYNQLHFSLLLRRFFDDLGLPPIAEPLPNLVDNLSEELLVLSFTRSLRTMLDNSSCIVADHLASLLFPYVAKACQMLARTVRYYFFYSDPAKEISELQKKVGVLPDLGEFIWRNVVVGCARHDPEKITFVNTGCLTPESTHSLLEEICGIYGITLPHTIPPPVASAFSTLLPLSPLTSRLYKALQEEDKKSLGECARELYDIFKTQAGWEFVNALDCGEIAQQAKRLAPHKIGGLPPAIANSVDLPGDEAGWLCLLDEYERELLRMRQEHESELFFHSHALQSHYASLLADERDRAALLQEEKNVSRRKRRLRHKERLRKLIIKVKNGQ